MLLRNHRQTIELGSGGKPPAKPQREKQNPAPAPLVACTAFGAKLAEALRQRLDATLHPAEKPALPPSQPEAPDPRPDFESDGEPQPLKAEYAATGEEIFLSMNAVDYATWSMAMYTEPVQSLAISLRTQNFILHYLDEPLEYLERFADYGYNKEDDAAAEAFLLWYIDRFRDDLQWQKETQLLKGWSREWLDTLQDLANDSAESLVAVDLDARQTLFTRQGDADFVSLQEIHRQQAAKRNVILFHNHPNHTPASPADLDAALWLDAEYLIIVTPYGDLRYYKRVGGRMLELPTEREPEFLVWPEDPLETLANLVGLLAQRHAEADDPPEMVMLQGEASAFIEIAGAFRGYGDQWSAADRLAEPETHMEYDFSGKPRLFRVRGRSTLNPSLVQIEVQDPIHPAVYHHWINLEDLGDNFRIRGSDLETVPVRYARQSIVADESLDVELSNAKWADRAERGLRSRDLNPRGLTHAFEVQSPMIGPDVRVEYVVREYETHVGLGNTVIISFPASAFLDDPMLMQALASDHNHNPALWRRDGRIFYSFGHLSHIAERVRPQSVIDSIDKASIGLTGNTGMLNPEDNEPYPNEHDNRHLDLIIAHYGSEERNALDENETSIYSSK